eukprot:3737683-Prymnesium_polylepis.2
MSTLVSSATSTSRLRTCSSSCPQTSEQRHCYTLYCIGVGERGQLRIQAGELCRQNGVRRRSEPGGAGERKRGGQEALSFEPPFRCLVEVALDRRRPQYTQWECTLARQCSLGPASLHWHWQ